MTVMTWRQRTDAEVSPHVLRMRYIQYAILSDVVFFAN